MQGPLRNAAYWLSQCGLLCLLPYRTQDNQPRDGTTHNGLGPPQSITNEENTLQLYPTEAFSHLRFLLQDI